ncbi:hypothetical protein ACGFZK_35130 [Streptomyces sp. NPDC048257]
MSSRLALSPMPNQAVASGTSAMAGIGRRKETTGVMAADTFGR